MKKITLSAEEALIQKARNKALAENSLWNQRFREWLAQYVSGVDSEKQYDLLMKELQYANPGKVFTQDEMNER